jgi:hypothetical protein
MGDLTPYQGQVLDAARQAEAEAKEERMEEARNGSGGAGGQTPSTGSQTGKMEQEETVRYINESEQ